MNRSWLKLEVTTYAKVPCSTVSGSRMSFTLIRSVSKRDGVRTAPETAAHSMALSETAQRRRATANAASNDETQCVPTSCV